MIQDTNYTFRKAEITDQLRIWQILQQAIARRKADGSTQWQDGYPNPDTIEADINNNYGYVMKYDSDIAAYAAVISDPDPDYADIDGKWLREGKYLVIHRVAVADKFAGKGVATEIFKQVEKLAISIGINSVKVDTNFDNAAMLRVLEKLDYTYCGDVIIRGNARRAFEKVLV